MVDAVQIASLLEASRRAHLRYRQFAPRMTAIPGAHPIADAGSAPDAEVALIEARDLRSQAHKLDPEHLAAAWGREEASHDEFMAYYASKLATFA